MNVLKRIAFVAMVVFCASCSKTPSMVIFELPTGFRGPLVLKEGHLAAARWARNGERWTLKVEKPITVLDDLSSLSGRFLKYQANLGAETQLQLRERIDANKDEIGFFGGTATADREIHFFIGSREQADHYFDALTGK